MRLSIRKLSLAKELQNLSKKTSLDFAGGGFAEDLDLLDDGQMEASLPPSLLSTSEETWQQRFASKMQENRC